MIGDQEQPKTPQISPYSVIASARRSIRALRHRDIRPHEARDAGEGYDLAVDEMMAALDRLVATVQRIHGLSEEEIQTMNDSFQSEPDTPAERPAKFTLIALDNTTTDSALIYEGLEMSDIEWKVANLVSDYGPEAWTFSVYPATFKRTVDIQVETTVKVEAVRVN